MNELFHVNGKIALITGGAGGIGLACAKALAEAGADIILADIESEGLELARAEIGKREKRCMAAVCDVSNPESVSRLTEQAEQFGGIDILLHCAAVTNRIKLLDMTTAEWQELLAVNLNGAYYVGQQVGQLMVKQARGGKMTFVVSTGAYRAGVNFGAYSASKAGVVMMMKTLALELAEYGITVNAIAPTATETRFTEDYYREYPEVKAQVIKNHPLGRIATAVDYMGTAVYLSSPASDFVTGTLLIVDGGKTAK